MHIVPTIHFELYWQGSCSYGDKGVIEGVCLQIDRITEALYASLNRDASSQKPQRLNFRVDRKWITDLEFNSFECRIDLLQKMILSAKVLQKDQQRTAFPIAIDQWPSFEAYQNYQVNMRVHEETIASMERQWTESSESEPIEGELDSMNGGFAHIQRLVRSYASPHQKWANMSTVELQKLFDQTYDKYNASTLLCEQAFISGNRELMEAESRAKLQIQEEVLTLRRALQKRGIPKDKLAPSECIIS